jgi:hypothetical protein
MDEVSTALQSPLATLLESRLMDWRRAREPQEQKLLDCYYDVMRIVRDDDTKGTGHAKAKKAKGLFMGSTRNKVRSARAKINDALFGNGKLPFDTNPVNEQLAPFADVVEDILTEQLERGKFKEKLSAGTNTLATYGTGFMFGPFVRRETLTDTYAENAGGSIVIKENRYEFDFPYFELGATLDVYPDPEAHDIKDAMGCFWVTLTSPDTVRSWKSQPGYKDIDEALKAPEGDDRIEGSEKARQMRGNNASFWHENNRIRVARYFGKVPKSTLHGPSKDGSTDGEQVDVVVIMAGGVVVKVDESPWGDKKPVLPCVYEAADHEIWGVGVAENNAPNQKNINAAFRLMNEGKGIALNPPISIDRSKFLPMENFKIGPGKVYDMKPGLSVDDRKNAVIVHPMPDVSNGWMDLIQMSEQFSDDDTGITKYTQGDDSTHLNKTATGISMIMSASSLPIKEVIQHIDSMWIEPMIECLIEWNLKYLEVETVQKIHGEEHAQIWAQIKEFGKSSFMEWKATGTSSFMQKEVLANKLQSFSQFALSNPMTAEKIDVRELLEQTWDVLEIGRESPIVKDEDGGKIPPQVQQQMQQAQQQMQQMQQMIQQLQRQLQQAQSRENVEMAKIEANRELQIILQQMKSESADKLKELEGAVQIILKRMEQGVAPIMAAAEAGQATELVDGDNGPPGMPQDAMTQQQAPQGAFFTPDAMPPEGMQ